eukprot:6199761-Pleurochrysis_carterae.AAC.2
MPKRDTYFNWTPLLDACPRGVQTCCRQICTNGVAGPSGSRETGTSVRLNTVAVAGALAATDQGGRALSDEGVGEGDAGKGNANADAQEAGTNAAAADAEEAA